MILERSKAEILRQVSKPLARGLERAVQVGLLGVGERPISLPVAGLTTGSVRPEAAAPTGRR